MPALRDDIDPDGLLEYSVVFSDRSLNSMTVASGAILQPLVGLALDLSWDGTIMDGARHYAAADYRMAFLLVLATLVIGLLTAFSLRETTLEDGML